MLTIAVVVLNKGKVFQNVPPPWPRLELIGHSHLRFGEFSVVFLKMEKKKHAELIEINTSVMKNIIKMLIFARLFSHVIVCDAVLDFWNFLLLLEAYQFLLAAWHKKYLW